MVFSAAPDSRTELREYVVDGPGASSHQSNVTGVFLDQNDAQLFEAVANGDLELVKSILNDASNPVNINAINSDGDTALQLAVDNKHFDIMTELLNKKADLKIALLQCVMEDNLECVRVLLCDKPDDISGDSYITPTILAAQLGHYEIVHFLIQNNYLIEEPHEYECSCESCESKSDMLRSQIAINRFRGLSSPVYMCLTYLVGKGEKLTDPLTQAFELNMKIQKRATDEAELKKDYLKLSEKCKTFATDLYNGCRSMKEIKALLDIDETDFDLSSGKKVNNDSRANVVQKLRKAIESNHKEFVAHPHTQQLLNVVVHSGAPNLRTKPFLIKSILFLLYTILFPILFVIYILLPKSRIAQMLRTPFLKFVSHISQFLVFLAFIAASSLRNNHLPTGIEYIIFVAVAGMIVQEFCEMLHHKPRTSYFLKWWNIVTTVMLTLFVLAAVTWTIGFAITGGWSVVDISLKKYVKPKRGYELLLLGNSFFSLGIVVSVFHLIDLSQVNSVLGPLQLSLYRMLRDVLKFLLFFAAIFFAFVMGVRNLYSYYNSIQEEIAGYGNKNNSMQADTNHPFSTFGQSTQSMFWALFDKIELEDFNTKDKTFDITQGTGKILFGFYSICAIMVLLNMLIAMMSHSYDYISEDEDIQWKFSRTRLWLEFVEKGSTLPAPYNLLPNPYDIYCFVTRKYKEHVKGVTGFHPKDDSKVQGKDGKAQEERKTVIKRLVRRYFLMQESQRKKELGTLKDIEESKSEIIQVLKDNVQTNAKL